MARATGEWNDRRHDLASPDWLVREQCVRALGSSVLGAAGVTRLLLKGARDPEGEVRKAAIESLGKLSPTRRRVLAILDALRDAEWEVRWAAVRSLERLRLRTGVVQRALEQALTDADPSVTEGARAALATLESELAPITPPNSRSDTRAHRRRPLERKTGMG